MSFIKLTHIPRISTSERYAEPIDCYINVSEIVVIGDSHVRKNVNSSILFSCGHYLEFTESLKQILKMVKESK